MEIKQVLVEVDQMFRSIGDATPLKGSAEVTINHSTKVEFELSRESMQTIQECVERDYDKVRDKL